LLEDSAWTRRITIRLVQCSSSASNLAKQTSFKETVKNILSKTGKTVKRYQYDLFVTICMVLIGFIGFDIGRISTLKKTPLTLGEANIFSAANGSANDAQPKQAASAQISKTDTRVVVSKKSTSKLYHFSWCSGAKRIKEENKIWFDNEQSAISAGYTLAGNCVK